MSLTRAYEKQLEMDDNGEAKPVAKPQGSSRPTGINRGSLLDPSLALRGPPTGISTIAATPQINKPPNSSFRRLTTEEMADRRLKDLCFNCSEKFSKDHATKCSMKGIYLLELDDGEVSDSASDEDMEISLHALTGIRLGKTMQLQVDIQDESMRALVNSGSTHNFMAEETTRHLDLTPASDQPINVAVVNGNKVTSMGLFWGIHVQISNEDFFLDCYVIPLAGFDIVLGVQWLRTLGPITGDFDQLTMSFWRHDHKVIWRGLQAQSRCSTLSSLDSANVMSSLSLNLPRCLPSLMAYLPHADAIIKSIFFQAPLPWWFARTDIFSCLKMKSNVSARRC